MSTILKSPVIIKYRISDDFAAHVARSSNAPGIDLVVPTGTTVHAVDSGYVKWCHWGDAGGRYVMIKHPGNIMTLYSHLLTPWVVINEYVSAGEMIGLSGNSGKHTTGPHLHFAIKDLTKNKWIDPAPLLGPVV